VGKTAPSASTVGVEARQNGSLIATKDGDKPLLLNRQTSDGDILELRKDGSTIGSIGAYSSRMYIGTGDVGLQFLATADNIIPINPSTPANRDGAIDLGADTVRFKDLYLSGTATMGGLTVDGSGVLATFGNTAGNNSIGVIRTTTSPSSAYLGAFSNTGVVFYSGSAGIKFTNNDTSQDSFKIASNGDISFYEDTGSTPKFFWSASAESLGIGVQPETWYPTNPAIQIGLQGVIHATQTGYLQVANNVYRDTDANFKRINTGEASRINFNPDSSIFFSQASSDSADTTISWTNVGTFDTSGNFLVGTTDSSVWDSNADSTADNGGNIRNDGRAGFSYYNASGTNATLNINRTGSDGILAEFRRTGSAVGSIGNTGTTLKINGVNSGFYVGGTNAVIYPQTDNTHNLGTPTLRFEHLYLGGGVYLGGTGSANFLDDYEEGTWTPVAEFAVTNPTAGAKSGTGSYIKVGKLCTVTCSLDNINVTGASGDLKITGLPFGGSTRTSIPIYMGAVRTRSLTVDDGYLVAQIQDGVTFMDIFENNYSSGGDNINTANCSHGASDFNVTITYETN